MKKRNNAEDTGKKHKFPAVITGILVFVLIMEIWVIISSLSAGYGKMRAIDMRGSLRNRHYTDIARAYYDEKYRGYEIDEEQKQVLSVGSYYYDSLIGHALESTGHKDKAEKYLKRAEETALDLGDYAMLRSEIDELVYSR